MTIDRFYPKTEMAHVLFMDLVGFSPLPMEEQLRCVQALQTVVQQTQEFQGAERSRELISLDRGDGMALVFFHDPIAPLRCAVEIARGLSAYPHLRLRMGINTGPVTRTIDINATANVSGGGINLAQRIMDCGDAGHILLSANSAEIVRQFASWSNSLHDLGTCEVKHQEKVHLYNFQSDRIGNPAVPQKLRGPAFTATVPAAYPAPVATCPPDAPIRQIALLYKRHAPDSAHLVRLLETRLTAEGYSVFVDRNMSVGVEWAREIKRQVCASYAVIPLLSAESIWSEMIEEELQIAHETWQRTGHTPRILPVRVHYEGPLPEPLAHILDALQYTLWQGAQDDEKILQELLKALKMTPVASSLMREKLEPVGGAVPLDSRFYIERPTDEEFRIAIARQDSIVLVKGARQVGKTSLLARGLQQARLAGARCIRTDLQKLNVSRMETVESFFLTLGEMIADQLDLSVLPDEVWSPKRGPNVNFERYLRREVLNKIDAPIVWALDEVDRLFTCPFGAEVFGLFRSWHNERSLDPEQPWSRLTLAIAYATEAHLFISDLNQSPFNVGTRLTLDDFTIEQVEELNVRYGEPLRSAADVRRFHALVGGQPYLVRRGLDQMTAYSMPLTELEAQADRDEGIFGDHLRRILVLLSQDRSLAEVVKQVLEDETILSAVHFYRLRSGGLITGTSERNFRMRNPLYTRYLQRHLL